MVSHRECSRDAATTAVTLGAQIGGTDAHEKTYASILSLKKLLREFCVGPYSESIEEFAPIVRVDGAIQQFGISGIAKMRKSTKRKYITADLVFTVTEWKNKTEGEFKALLFARLNDAVELFLARLAKDKIYVDSEALRNDLREVKLAYLPN
jgi:hypothetical protein